MKEKKKSKSFWSSRGFQGAVCVISFIVLTGSVLGSLMGATAVRSDSPVWDYIWDYNYYGYDELIFDSLVVSDYERHGLFRETLLQEVHRQAGYAWCNAFLESKGHKWSGLSGEERLRLLKQETIELNYPGMLQGGEETGILYRIGDLLAWNDTDIEFYALTQGQMEILLEKRKEDPDYRVDFADEYDQMEMWDKWREYDSGIRYECILNEEFLPVSGDSLYTYAGDAETLERYTCELLTLIGYVQQIYTSDLTGEQSVESGVTLAIANPSMGITYSSFPDDTGAYQGQSGDLYEDLYSYTTQKSRYLIYDAGVKAEEGNIPIDGEEIRRVAMMGDGDVLYLVWDGSLSGDNAIARGYRAYTAIRRGGIVFLTVFCAALILFLVSLCRRTALEGRGADQKPRRIDRWRTILLPAEMFAVCLVSYWIVINGTDLLSSWRWSYEDGDTEGIVIYGGVGTALFAATAAVFAANMLYFFLELVKRYKQRTLWKKSMLLWLYGMWKKIAAWIYRRMVKTGSRIRKLLDLINGRVKWVAGYLLFLLVNLVIVLVAMDDSDAVFLMFLLIIADLAAGASVLAYFREQEKIRKHMQRTVQGEMTEPLSEEQFHGMNRRTVQLVNNMELGISRAVEKSLKDERMRTELITNVSHDIRTPLTSIINYVDLLKKEPVQSEKAREYISVLEEKSARLKQLTDDLMEASKITSGNISVVPVRMSIRELAQQMAAEYEEKLNARELTLVVSLPKEEDADAFLADSRHVWRVLSNLFSNLCKYAMPRTRVYLNAYRGAKGGLCVELKNVSECPLNISPEELTERFVRGDESRSAEGNGLGLSIAKSLMQAMHGALDIAIDGDLFKVILRFPGC